MRPLELQFSYTTSCLLQFYIGKLLWKSCFTPLQTTLCLRVFGCACYPNTRPYNMHKLKFRSTQCTFLGYSLNHKDYKCLDTNDKIFISRDVIFYEHSFPFSFSNSSQTFLASQASNISSISSSSPLPPNFLPFSYCHLYLIDPKHMLKHILVKKVLLLTMVAIRQLLWKRQLNLLLLRERQLNLLLNRFWWALLSSTCSS